MSNCYNGYMVNNNNMIIQRDPTLTVIVYAVTGLCPQTQKHTHNNKNTERKNKNNRFSWQVCIPVLENQKTYCDKHKDGVVFTK